MLTIWKTELKIIDDQTVKIPHGAEILLAKEQFDKICIWYRCDPNAPKEDRSIRICGTGHPTAPEISTVWRYIGTAVIHGGDLVFHVFENG